MSDTDRTPTADTDPAAAIARLAAELLLTDEPSGFVAALDNDPDVRDAREHSD
ncbi:MAG TPA: hypothetical protein VKG64_05310 [Methylomirabilota bacterium]|nr:hypothetical protein [Methylomirabilota bacterium]